MNATSRAAMQAAELHRAERHANRGLDEETSLAGVLVWALTPNGESSVVSGLLELIQRQLFAASTVESGGQEQKPWSEAAHRFTHAVIELDRRERAGRAEEAQRAEKAERAKQDEEDERAEEEAE